MITPRHPDSDIAPAKFLDIEAREKRLRDKINEIGSDTFRPNNALYGTALGLLLDLSRAGCSKDRAQLDAVWRGLADVIDRARGMGEFPAEMVDQVVDAMQPYAQASEAFDALIIKLAEFMGERAREGRAGAILLRRGEQRLEAEEPIEAIRWLGKASIYFMKEEYREEQFKALYCLAIAYRGAGLLWAARAAALSALVQATVLSDEPGGPRPELVPAATLFVMISIQLGRLVDALNVIQWLRGLHQMLPLTEASKRHLEGRLEEFDHLLMCLFANLGSDDLRELSAVPGILERLELFSSRLILMHLLGYAQALKKDGSMPEEVSLDELSEMTELAAAQPAARDLPKKLLTYSAKEFAVSTTVLGANVGFSAGASVTDHLLCEAHISALEAFLATAIETGAIAHADNLAVIVATSEHIKRPEMHFDAKTMTLAVNWPRGWDIREVSVQHLLCDHLIHFCARALDTIAMVNSEKDKGFISQVGEELLLQRAASFSNASIGNNRIFGTFATTLDDLNYLAGSLYPLMDDAPSLTKRAYLDVQHGKEREGSTDPERIVQSHRGYEVKSIINLHLWDKAGWNGMMFGGFGPQYPPVLALVFRDLDMAESIFEGWRSKFGERDEYDSIRLSLIKGVDRSKPAHYRALISREIDVEADGFDPSKKYVQASRMLTIEPLSSENLERFLADYHSSGCYFLAPAVNGAAGSPDFLMDHAILKRGLHVRQAWEIGLNDQDSVALRADDDLVIPAGIENPPCDEVLEFKRRMVSRG